MKLIPIPAFADNYIWMLHDGRDAVVVDPGEAHPVLETLQRNSLELVGILVTHRHADHIDGVAELVEKTGAKVWLPANEHIALNGIAVKEEYSVDLLGIQLKVIDIPGHTLGHIAYFVESSPLGSLLFCGDTLFSAGCGRVFEGTAAQMYASLCRLAQLPDSTLVCCAHEYTLSGLKFAQHVEPSNQEIEVHISKCQDLRSQGLPTLPSSIGLEKKINPFLRCEQKSLQTSAQSFDSSTSRNAPDTFKALREWKNSFR